MSGKRVAKVAEQVSKYLEAHSALVGPGPMPSEPLGRKSKGSSRPPAGAKALRFWEANIVPARYIDWRVTSLMRHNTSYGPVSFSELLTELYRNPAIVQAWKAGETEQDVIEYRAFQKLCYLIAQDILACNPDVQFSVVVNPKDEPADSPIQASNREKSRKQSHDAKAGYKSLYERFLSFSEQNKDMSRAAAKEEFILAEQRRLAKSGREAVSKRTLERAIRYVEIGEYQGEGVWRAWPKAQASGAYI